MQKEVDKLNNSLLTLKELFYGICTLGILSFFVELFDKRTSRVLKMICLLYIALVIIIILVNAYVSLVKFMDVMKFWKEWEGGI